MDKLDKNLIVLHSMWLNYYLEDEIDSKILLDKLYEDVARPIGIPTIDMLYQSHTMVKCYHDTTFTQISSEHREQYLKDYNEYMARLNKVIEKVGNEEI